MNEKHLHILRHSLGLDDNGHGRQYRNYYATAPDCDGYSAIQQLVEEGLMFRNGNIGAYEAFSVSDEGIVAALEKDYPK